MLGTTSGGNVAITAASSAKLPTGGGVEPGGTTRAISSYATPGAGAATRAGVGSAAAVGRYTAAMATVKQATRAKRALKPDRNTFMHDNLARWLNRSTRWPTLFAAQLRFLPPWAHGPAFGAHLGKTDAP